MDEKLHNLRHTLAHLLAAAVLELYPEAKPSIGPSIENGFYYDFDFGKQKISDEDLPKIEKKMGELLPAWNKFESRELSSSEAKEIYSNNLYKQELVDEIEEKGEKISFYKFGNFEDLCRGGHLENPAKEIDPKAFKLTHIAGAYWRGDEENQMLTRIYAAAFETEKDLKEHLEMLEEAKKRDHRKLGKELDLFIFSDFVGPGLPMFTPKGVIIRNQLEKYLEELQIPRDYKKVWIPHLAKKELYQTSGHWDKFSDNIFHVSSKRETDFVLKPMNCPHHTQIYASRPRSYRDLPVRYFEVTEQYRDEKPGQLHGLTRVRSITIDDAHVFCKNEQVEDEANLIYDIIDEYYKTFKMKIVPRLSLRDSKTPDKYIGDPQVWDSAEEQLRKVLKERVGEFEEIEGEAAFYGPKIDFDAEDVLGRKWQLATIQLDFAMPERFKLEFTNEKGQKEMPVMIHRAISGSLERFMAILIEHYAGVFPLWLSPEQIRILPISENHNKFAWKVCRNLRKEGFRVEVDDANDTLGKKISRVKSEKTPYYMVTGDKEVNSEILKIEGRDGKAQELSFDDLVEKLGREVDSKS